MRLPLLCEKSGAILLGLTASDQILVDLKIFKIPMDHIGKIFQMHFSQFFRVKYIVRCAIETHKSRTPCFSC